MSLFKFFYLFALAATSAKESKKSTKRLTFEDEQRWKQLLVSASNEDKVSYEKLLTEMSDYLNYFCGRYLYSETQKEDCVQECLLAIHKAKHTFNPSKPIGPWFFTIVRHKIIDQFRNCLLYTSPSPRDRTRSRMPSSA